MNEGVGGFVRVSTSFQFLAIIGFVGLSGCSGADTKEGPTKDEIAHMVTDYEGAITGVMIYKTGKPVYNHRIELYNKAGGESWGKVETLTDGRFYFKRLPPTEYILAPGLKDWDECRLTVYAHKFTNMTLQEPYWEGTTRKGGCIRAP